MTFIKSNPFPQRVPDLEYIKIPTVTLQPIRERRFTIIDRTQRPTVSMAALNQAFARIKSYDLY